MTVLIALVTGNVRRRRTGAAGPLFDRRHPELTVWRRPGRAGYRILLGPYRSLVDPLDAALREHAPGIYQSAVRER